MLTPEQVFKLQTQLSESHGTKRISEWLIGAAALLLLWSIAEAVFANENFLRAAASPLSLLALAVCLREGSKKRFADVAKKLSS